MIDCSFTFDWHEERIEICYEGIMIGHIFLENGYITLIPLKLKEAAHLKNKNVILLNESRVMVEFDGDTL